MVSQAIWFKEALVNFSKSTFVCEKFTRAYYHQIAFEIMLLPLQIEVISPTIGKVQLKHIVIPQSLM